MFITDRETLKSEIRRHRLVFINSREYYPEWDLLIDCDEKEGQTITFTTFLNRSGTEYQEEPQTFTLNIDCSSGSHRITVRPIKPYVLNTKHDYVVLTADVDHDIDSIELQNESIAVPASNRVESRRFQQIEAMRFQIHRMLLFWPRGYIFKRLRTGQICSHCTDPVSKKKIIKNCEFCLDTGVLYGYENIPYETGIFSVKENRIVQPEFVPNKKHIFQFFIESIVEILPEDIILVPDINATFLIAGESAIIDAWGFGIARQIQAHLLPADSIQHKKLYERLNQLLNIYEQ